MKQSRNWYVITGGPSTGKTTLLNELQSLGYAIVPEAARWVIDQGLAKGLTVAEIRQDEKKFQLDVLKRKVEVEAAQDPSILTFFDRGMHDTIAYLGLHNFKVEPWIHKLVRSCTYPKVFVLDVLPDFTKDYARTEDPSAVAKLNDLLFSVYADAGLPTFRLPAVSVKERLALILEHVKNPEERKIAA